MCMVWVYVCYVCVYVSGMYVVRECTCVACVANVCVYVYDECEQGSVHLWVACACVWLSLHICK
jgi:hypothetical protein